MKRKYKLETNLAFEVTEKKKKTVVTVIDNGVRMVLADIKTNEYFWCKTAYDENYLVVYSRGCMVNQIPLNIEAVYSIKTRCFLSLRNKRFKVLLEYMLICKKGFDLALVLQTINDKELEIVEEIEKEDLTRYLTAECGHITQKEVIQYILKQYPVLKSYTNLSGPISVINYRKLKEELVEKIGEDCLWFHVMPLPLQYVSNPAKINSNLICNNYKQIYISEAKFNQKRYSNNGISN